MSSPYDKGDAAKDTDSSTSSVSHAWHDSRDDSGARTGDDVSIIRDPPPDWADRQTESGINLFPSRFDNDKESGSSGK